MQVDGKISLPNAEFDGLGKTLPKLSIPGNTVKPNFK